VIRRPSNRAGPRPIRGVSRRLLDRDRVRDAGLAELRMQLAALSAAQRVANSLVSRRNT
jgi:hypothetical protein